jgi:hypothetical protein
MAAIIVSGFSSYQQYVLKFGKDRVRVGKFAPAVPQSPNPALRIVLPLFKSATAASAFL